MQTLNLFYEDPDPDRWFKYDHILRKTVRRIVRGKPKIGGQMMVALELMKGLDKLGIPYRFNDYNYAKKNSNELIGVIGKPHLLKTKNFKNPILFGASVFSHPLDAPNLLQDYPNIKRILVPGDWMRDMFIPYYGEIVQSWPVGINTYKWNQSIKKTPQFDFLIYDKIRWNHDIYEKTIITPIKQKLTAMGLTYTTIVYGEYKPEELVEKVASSRAAIFLCEHETQGLAYQQILASNTPIMAFDQQEYWLDPQYYPDTIKYGPVSSVPYWDERCGLKFKDFVDFSSKISDFMNKLEHQKFNPEKYISENLTLEKCAQDYANIYHQVAKSL
ncbi:glycosyltransferase [Pedobacter sp. Hv1]|uniref:glycosyltransferase n=1 Tax=Pedobacter sp. Hv1 TaxID=1740090 RepID=UPI0009E7CB49|nr:glycosyltransferase [Pedobacter sp. Hv1]